MDEQASNLHTEKETLKGIQSSEYAISAAQEEKPGGSYRKIPHGKALDAISLVAGMKPAKEDEHGNERIFEAGEVTLKICNSLKKGFSVSTHKLLLEAIRRFAKDNHTGAGQKGIRCPSVNIPLKEYALMCGYNATEHQKETAKEAEKEAERAENVLREIRKKVRDDLQNLYDASLSWRENIKGEPEDFYDLRILDAKGIKGGFIKATFSFSFSEYLLRLPLLQYPESLWRIDERNQNAYVIALRMAEHFSMDSNQRSKTANLLKVRTLLNYTAFPKVEDVREQGRSWRQRIKEPFEKALGTLIKSGFLEGWEYSFSKDVSMTDEEAVFPTYENWEKTLLHFTLKDAPDYTERLKAIDEKKRNQQEQSKRSKRAKR